MADIEELRILLTTQAQTQGAAQTRDALKQVRAEAQAAQQAVSAAQQVRQQSQGSRPTTQEVTRRLVQDVPPLRPVTQGVERAVTRTPPAPETATQQIRRTITQNLPAMPATSQVVVRTLAPGQPPLAVPAATQAVERRILKDVPPPSLVVQSVERKVVNQLPSVVAPVAAPTAGAASRISTTSVITDSTRALQAAEVANRQHAVAVRASELANRDQAAALRGVSLASRQAAQSHKEFASGFNTGDVLRFVGALTGVQIGLSLFASAGRAVKDVLSGAGEALIETQRTARATAASYGAAAEQFTRFASTLSAQTGFTRNAILEAALSARTLSDNYGLSIAQTQKLISVSADLARIRGIGVAEAFERVQSAVRGEAEASEFLGLTLNATFLKNNAMNGSLKDTFETMSDGQKAQVVYTELLRQTAKFQGLAAQSASGLEGAQRASALASAEFANDLGTLLEPTLIDVTKGMQGLTEAATEFIRTLNSGTSQERQAVQLAKNRDEMGKLVAQIGVTQNAFGVLTDTATGQLASVEVLADRLGVSWDDLLAIMEEGRDKFSGSASGLELVRKSVARLFPEVANLGVSISRAFSLADQLAGTTHLTFQQIAADISVLGSKAGTLSSIADALSTDDTSTRAQLAALQDVEKIKARIRAQDAAALAALERSRSLGARSEAGSQAARERNRLLDDLIPKERSLAEAQQAQSDAQAQVTALDVSGQQRQLNVAQSLADLRIETLLREVQIVDAQQKQADLADRITRAGRSNLDLVIAQARARQEALPSGEALNDNQFEQRRIQLDIAAKRADVQRGTLDRSALADIPDQRRQLRALRQEAPRLESNAAVDARPGELLDRQGTREELEQTVQTSILEQQRRGLDDQLAQMRHAQTLADERTAAIQRQLELQQLAETAATTAAKQNLLSATAAITAAEAAVKASIEFGENVGSTLQNVETTFDKLATLPTPEAPQGTETPPQPPQPPPPGQTPVPARPLQPAQAAAVPVVLVQPPARPVPTVLSVARPVPVVPQLQPAAVARAIQPTPLAGRPVPPTLALDRGPEAAPPGGLRSTGRSAAVNLVVNPIINITSGANDDGSFDEASIIQKVNSALAIALHTAITQAEGGASPSLTGAVI